MSQNSSTYKTDEFLVTNANVVQRNMSQFVEDPASDKMAKENETCLNYEKDFNSKSQVKSNERAFKCDCCDQRFFRRDHLNNHLKIHTGEKPFQCECCEKDFTLKGDLN